MAVCSEKDGRGKWDDFAANEGQGKAGRSRLASQMLLALRSSGPRAALNGIRVSKSRGVRHSKQIAVNAAAGGVCAVCSIPGPGLWFAGGGCGREVTPAQQ